MKKLKIFNDPVYGFISVPDGLIMELIEHTVFQRLRRIKQLGLSDFIYPGATHSRFHHALGAFHLMTEALDSLRLKGVSISVEEYEASQIAILLHDIGHGPFSHVLEHSLLPVAHEEITILLMEWLNVEFKGRLSLALRIFKNQYSRSFFHDLISSQLDVDRLDYLTRDSFFTGVAEGVIGYDRLIKMMDVHEDHIVLEEKGLYSIEKFLVARRIMYWQVYMHKTAIAAEKMLHSIFELVKSDLNKYIKNSPLIYFIDNEYHNKVDIHSPDFIDRFLAIDDSDIWQVLKQLSKSDHKLLRYLSKGILERRFLKIYLRNEPFSSDFVDNMRLTCANIFDVSAIEAKVLIQEGSLDLTVYSHFEKEINIKSRHNHSIPLSEVLDLHSFLKSNTKYYCTVPKDLYS